MGKPELDIAPEAIDPDLLAQAERLGISVAGMSERQLRLHLQKIDPAGAEERAKRWAQENAEAITDHNARVARRGLISDHFRKW